MSRPKRCRKIRFDPNVTYFKPRGIPVRELDEIVLLYEECEAIRLKDLNGFSQEECAKKMQISQPTFYRILLSARRKLSEAIVKGKAIRIERSKE